MKNRVILTLPYPISANVYWRTRVIKNFVSTYVSTEAKEYKKRVLALARAAGIVAPIVGRVQIEIWLYPNQPQDWQKRQRLHGAAWDDTVRCIDLDNANKVLLDALKDVVIEDDAWVRRIASQRMEPDQKGARVLVRVSAIEVVQPQAKLLGAA